MILNFFQYIALAILLFIGSGLPAWALDIQNVRFGTHPEKTRMVIELDQGTDFKAFVLPPNEKTNPTAYRLVVDLPTFSWSAGTISRPPKTTVMDVRSGNLQPGIKRLVVDLSKPSEIKTAFFIPPRGGKPNRLVIDFATVSSNRFNLSHKKTLGTLVIPEPSPQQTLSILDDIFGSNRDKAASTQPTKTAVIIPPRKPQASKRQITSKSPAAKTPLKKRLIVVDAGHGGADPGAIGANRSYEKHVTLSAAKVLKKKLESTGRYRVVLTRENDTYLKLYKRVSIARHHDADLFISLHADSIGQSNVRGASIYTLSNRASDAQTAKLAARENQVDLIAGVDLSHEDKDVANILIDLAMRDTMNQSKFFANTVVKNMRNQGIRILEKPHRFAGFAVLKAPDIPSVLVEMGFMSNNKEARLLATQDYQKKIAAALTNSIDSYFRTVQKNNVQ